MASSSSSSRSEKRCLYEVLGINKQSSPEEIRTSYRRLALQRHPDKLIKAGGISESEATAQFQELIHAYEVLSDPKERAWYDSHRSQILFADNVSSSKSRGTVPDLFGFFSSAVFSGYADTGKGFYKVYYDVFNSVHVNEIKFVRTLGLSVDSVKEAPIMGNLDSPYAQVTAFYNYWLGFSTVMDFCWVDEYDAMAGPNRKSRRLMEEKNKKTRKKAKKEYNETVRRLAEFVKKRDKRVIDMMVKKNEEMEKKKAEEKERKKKMEKEKLERAMNYEEPDWAKAEDGEEEGVGIGVAEEEDNDGKRKNEQLYCIVCSKKFKSDKQWKNHEQSKKHKEKVAELRESFSDVEDEKDEEEVINEPHESVEDLQEKLQERLNIDDEEEIGETDVGEEVVGEGDEADDEYFVAEEYVIEASESTNDATQTPEDNGNTDDNTNATDTASEAFENSLKDEPMKYDNRKTTGRRRRSKKDKNNLGGLPEKSSEADDTQYRNLDKEESRPEKFEDRSEYIEHKKAPRSKKSTRGMKNKGTSTKASNNECDKCGEDFESRSKLFKHIADTGHATVKSR
ncbi:unnamed protein product [Cochlearia groenlandica]